MKSILLILPLLFINLATNAVLLAGDYEEASTEIVKATSNETVDFQSFSGNTIVQGERRNDISVTKLITVRRNRDANVSSYQEKVEQTLERKSGIFRLFFENEEHNRSIIPPLIGADHSISISLDSRVPKHITGKLNTSGGNFPIHAL